MLATVTEAEGCLEEAAGRGILESKASGRQGICSLVHTFNAVGNLNNRNPICSILNLSLFEVLI